MFALAGAAGEGQLWISLQSTPARRWYQLHRGAVECCAWNQLLGHRPPSSSHTELRLSHGDLENVRLLLDKMYNSDTT